MIYNKDVIKLVEEIYHKDSKVYQSLMRGEKISKLVKESFSKKGFGVMRIKDKKQLFALCKVQESEYEQKNNVDEVNV